ncbi:MAG: prepilin-type N-terminal cleavage/methylation domain-containing protein [Candidatus Omnitrophica bacterium]|nr:prepilin-type N-terminal cleavage/methylation domain-containing protein [Candidatus Omnitrophota bacterium]
MNRLGSSLRRHARFPQRGNLRSRSSSLVLRTPCPLVGNKARLKETTKPLWGRKRTGFTLVEIMVSVVLASFILGVILFLYLGSQRSFDSSRTYLDIYADARLALDWMSKDIKWATQVLSAWGGYTTSTNCLVLEIPSIDTNRDIIPDEYDYLIYQLNLANLERIMDAYGTGSSRIDNTNVIANNISSLIFSSAGTYVAIELTASRTRLNRTYQETLNSVVKLRNK